MECNKFDHSSQTPKSVPCRHRYCMFGFDLLISRLLRYSLRSGKFLTKGGWERIIFVTLYVNDWLNPEFKCIYLFYQVHTFYHQFQWNIHQRKLLVMSFLYSFSLKTFLFFTSNWNKTIFHFIFYIMFLEVWQWQVDELCIPNTVSIFHKNTRVVYNVYIWRQRASDL